jgi:hypothetical protein
MDPYITVGSPWSCPFCGVAVTQKVSGRPLMAQLWKVCGRRACIEVVTFLGHERFSSCSRVDRRDPEVLLCLMAQVLTERCEGRVAVVLVSSKERPAGGAFEDGQLVEQVRSGAAEDLGGLVDAGLVGEGHEAFEAEQCACSAECVA